MTGQSTDRRVTVADAALLLGLSEDAVRSRLKRGTLRRDKGPDGTVLVVLGDGDTTDRPTINGDQPATGQRTDQTSQALMQAHLDSLEEQVSFLRAQLVTRDEELRRKDHLLAALAERLPAIEPPSEARESPEAAAGNTEGAETHPATHKPSFLRRFFGI
jgi:hypothetical protein